MYIHYPFLSQKCTMTKKKCIKHANYKIQKEREIINSYIFNNNYKMYF